jgi:Ser/Thr protein kinase RdoA (MazF antagonist)
MNPIQQIAQFFAPRHTVSAINNLGNGLINDTFLATTEAGCFVLQRINQHVFPAPELITENLLILNQHVDKNANAQLKIPGILKTAADDPYFKDDNGDYWRAQSFIDNSESLEIIRTLADAEAAGFALGHFHRLLSDLDPNLLNDTLPGFHIATDYLNRYHQVAALTTKGQSFCEHFINKHQALAETLETAKQQGLLPIRVIHGDPKLNNFLFDKDSRKIISLIDLDTVKPGLVHYDIGDCIRSCCHVLTDNTFDMDVCEAILKSYLIEASAFFSAQDYQYLFPAIQLIPFELGIRFYTDYLEGNRYFKVTDPEQNLFRAIAQFELCAEITNHEQAIQDLIRRLVGAKPNADSQASLHCR